MKTLFNLTTYNLEKFNDVTYTCLNLMGNIANMLEPFIPKSSKKLKEMLKITTDNWNYVTVEQNLHLNNVEILFNRIDSE